MIVMTNSWGCRVSLVLYLLVTACGSEDQEAMEPDAAPYDVTEWEGVHQVTILCTDGACGSSLDWPDATASLITLQFDEGTRTWFGWWGVPGDAQRTAIRAYHDDDVPGTLVVDAHTYNNGCPRSGPLALIRSGEIDFSGTVDVNLSGCGTDTIVTAIFEVRGTL